MDDNDYLFCLKNVFFQLSRSFIAVSFAASNLGHTVSMASDAKKASRAADAIFEILHRQPQLQPNDGDFPNHKISGEIVFNKLHFRYPSRKKVPVLKVGIYSLSLN